MWSLAGNIELVSVLIALRLRTAILVNTKKIPYLRITPGSQYQKGANAGNPI